MTLGERIKELRNDRGITQLELANALFVTDRAVSKWEQGRGNPDLATLPIIASYFGVSLDYLLTGEEHVASLNDNKNELIKYFENVVGQEITNEYIQRLITKPLEKYSVPKIKDALDICYDSYLLKKDKPLQINDIRDALNKLGGILYNNDLPALDRAINRLMFYLQKNTVCPTPYLWKDCNNALHSLLEPVIKTPNGNDKALRLVERLYKQCVEEKLDLIWGAEEFTQLKQSYDKRDKPKEQIINNENLDNDPFASIGNGRIKLSIGACHLVKNFSSCHYVTFTRIKQDRIYFVGLRFEINKSETSFTLYKDNDGEYGATIFASNLLNTLYGEEGSSTNYTKHEVIVDPNNPDALVIYYNYKHKHYLRGDKKKPLRTRHINTIIDKEWKVISSSSKATNGKKYPTYLIRNINTGEEMEISTRALADIEKGVSTIDGIKMSREIGVASYLGIKRASKKKRIKKLVDDSKTEKSEDNKGKKKSRAKKPNDVRNLSSEEFQKIKDSDLFKELKEWRLKMAKEQNVVPFSIASDRMLAAVVISKPKTKDDLLNCYGFGKKKVEEIGFQILSILVKHL